MEKCEKVRLLLVIAKSGQGLSSLFCGFRRVRQKRSTHPHNYSYQIIELKLHINVTSNNTNA